MKILHLILSCFYKEGYGYQENILPYKHRQLGYETFIVTRFAPENILPIKEDFKGVAHYVNNRNIDVFVLPTNKSLLCRIPLLSRLMNHTRDLAEVLDRLSPDVVFCHGIYISDYRVLIKYAESHSGIKVFVDNHSDYYNTPVKKGIIATLYRQFFQVPIVRRLERCSTMMWGVTPWRVDYMREVFGIKKSKSDLLVMGGDEELIDWRNRGIIRKEIRNRFNISDSEFVLVSGGKIDKSKNIHLLVDAVKDLKGISLILFGSISDELKSCIDGITNVYYIGWLESDKVYDVFLTADLGVFPGTHSVLWEQACAAGLPCIFKDWDGHMNHVDVGGNCVLLKDINSESLKRTILDILENHDSYNKMKKISQTKARFLFSYCYIAQKSIMK